MKNISLIHAERHTSDEFRRRMVALGDSLNAISGIQVIDPNFVSPGDRDRSINFYDRITRRVASDATDLAVFVWDFQCDELGMIFQKRCDTGRPTVVFYPTSIVISPLVQECIEYNRRIKLPDQKSFPDPIKYVDDAEILAWVSSWIYPHINSVQTHLNRPVLSCA